ncbi:hypothetical protein PV04_10848 [Phialophora macrospora]|uniref:Uncharacterized protein n=1 Tax=Phialophora macrospora TaxID=1851006 RepID=A0A0D2CCA6_9EURO|nr:hypothetical protein PV04_10848 [Phialophora macrospora]
MILWTWRRIVLRSVSLSMTSGRRDELAFGRDSSLFSRPDLRASPSLLLRDPSPKVEHASWVSAKRIDGSSLNDAFGPIERIAMRPVDGMSPTGLGVEIEDSRLCGIAPPRMASAAQSGGPSDGRIRHR